MERYTLDTPPNPSSTALELPSRPSPGPTLHSVLCTQLHQALIQHYSGATSRSPSPLIPTTKSALRDLKNAFPNVWEDYKRTGKPTLLVSTTQAQTLRSDTLPKSLLKSLISEVGRVLKCYIEAGGEVGKAGNCRKRLWSVGHLAELAGEIEAVDRTTKQVLREGIRRARNMMFANRDND